MHYASTIHNVAFTVVLGYVELCCGTGDNSFQKKQYQELCKVTIQHTHTYIHKRDKLIELFSNILTGSSKWSMMILSWCSVYCAFLTTSIMSNFHLNSILLDVFAHINHFAIYYFWWLWLICQWLSNFDELSLLKRFQGLNDQASI